jgi:hypothetical protein
MRGACGKDEDKPRGDMGRTYCMVLCLIKILPGQELDLAPLSALGEEPAAKYGKYIAAKRTHFEYHWGIGYAVSEQDEAFYVDAAFYEPGEQS